MLESMSEATKIMIFGLSEYELLINDYISLNDNSLVKQKLRRTMDIVECRSTYDGLL